MPAPRRRGEVLLVGVCGWWFSGGECRLKDQKMKANILNDTGTIAQGVDVTLNESPSGSWGGSIKTDVALYFDLEYVLELADGRKGEIRITTQAMMGGFRPLGAEPYEFVGLGALS
jgi:hypothetical protein